MVAPEFSHAAWLAHNLSLPVRLAHVDVDKERDLAERYGVTSFPTFFLFRNFGQAESFPMLTTGEAYIAGLSNLLELGAEIAPSKVFGPGSTSADLAKWLFWRGANEGKIANTLVLYEPSAEAIVDPERRAEAAVLTRTFDLASRDLLRNPNFRFAIVRSPSAFEDFELDPSRVSVVFYKDHDEGRVEFTAAEAAKTAGSSSSSPSAALADPAVLVKWVEAHAVPLATLITHRNLRRYRKTVSHLALFFVSEAQSEHPGTVSRLVSALFNVASSLERRGLVKRGNFTLGLTNGQKYGSWLAHYGLPADVTLPVATAEMVATETLFTAPQPVAEEAACDAGALAAFKASIVDPSWEIKGMKVPPFCPGASESVEVDADGSSSSAVGEPSKYDAPVLHWVDVPAQKLEAFLESVLVGVAAPVVKAAAAAAA
jgi:hypothetical protein